jgi:hypothetical protein
MFYIGFLSSSIPYALFLLITVFYLGFNFMNPEEADVYEEMPEKNELSVRHSSNEVEEATINFSAFFTAEISTEELTYYTIPEVIQSPRPKPLRSYDYFGRLWARPPPAC